MKTKTIVSVVIVSLAFGCLAGCVKNRKLDAKLARLERRLDEIELAHKWEVDNIVELHLENVQVNDSIFHLVQGGLLIARSMQLINEQCLELHNWSTNAGNSKITTYR